MLIQPIRDWTACRAGRSCERRARVAWPPRAACPSMDESRGPPTQPDSGGPSTASTAARSAGEASGPMTWRSITASLATRRRAGGKGRAHGEVGMVSASSVAERRADGCGPLYRPERPSLRRPGDLVTSPTTTAAPPPPAAAANAGTGPEKSGLVLLSLILVAAVANLNLSVANVALPDIGKAFDASQTALDLVAVGYSLGLAASVLWLGALGDRYGRKLMLLLGILLSIPACIVAATAPSIEILIARPDRRRHLRRHGLPDDPRPDRRPVVRACPDPVDRPVVGPRRGDRGTRTAGVGLPARALRVGLGLHRHPAAGGRRAGHGHPVRAGPRQRDDREGRQPRRDPVGGDDRRR